MKNKKIKKIFGETNRPRISVFRSNREIYAQIIDDFYGKTLTCSSSIDKEFIKKKYKKKTKVELSYEVGKLLGVRAEKLKIKKLVFDKGKYLYHGRIKSLADGIREYSIKL
ncbi:50S ribosomal protein L18 [Blattabacterium cuenoti]|uniref:50S ribosomal protein L18 n=1 Tax=Blattabacterium cuenoti TaxID=1653831 RepID=UPI00163C893F|nr:50S ribosomal protein L18 [Blattabacterium cuenoti]